MIDIRWSSIDDAPALAEVHEAAWRFANAGLIPGLTLERMIAGRQRNWWAARQDAGDRCLVLAFDGRPAGYAMFGRRRGRGLAEAGEIYELYLDPICHGAGLGRRLFGAARERLRDDGLSGLIVWTLAVNEAGCRFYRALGGKTRARSVTRLGRERFDLVGFAWP